MNYLLASENCLYPIGGAEISLYAYALDRIPRESALAVVSLSNSGSELNYRQEYPRSNIYKIPFRFGRARKHLPFFFTQMLFLGNIRLFVKAIKSADVILTQNRWYPYIFLMTRFVVGKNRIHSKVLIFIRDEKCLLVYRPYVKGSKRIAWYLRQVVEFPFRLIHGYLASYALGRATVVFNSGFMSRLAADRGLKIAEYYILEPGITKIDQARALQAARSQGDIYTEMLESRNNNLVLIGDEVVKGVDTVKRISQKLPWLTFIIVGKGQGEAKKEGNIVYLPWSDVPGVPYVLAATVLVPSVWLEAFGRVAREAQQFSCNVIVSNQGGLREAITGYPAGFIANSEDEFVELIKKIHSTV